MVVETSETPVGLSEPPLVRGGMALARMKAAPKPQDRSLPYYPSRRYVKEKLAPETKLTKDDFAAIAKAQKEAVQNGVLSPELAAYMLPIAIVEGRSGNYGIISSDKNGFYAKPSTIDRFRRMGLEIGPDGHLDVRDIPGKGPHLFPVMAKGKNGQDDYARLMAAILAEKSATYANGDPLLAVERYNGKGRAVEHADGYTQQADSGQYVDKVREAREMLDDPSNKQLKDFFAAAYAAR